MNFGKAATNVRSLKRLTAFRGSITRDIYFDNDATDAWDAEEEPQGERPQGDLVRIHKARVRQSTPVGTRLLSLVGEDIFQLLTHSEEDDPDNTGLASILSADLEDESTLKSVLAVQILPLLEEKLLTLTEEGRGVYWMMTTLLDGNIEIEGERWTVDELEGQGVSLVQLVKMFWTALSLALFPGRGAPATSDGSNGPAAPEKSEAPRTSSINGESAKMTGQSVPMSANPG